MCGRFVLNADPNAIQLHFNLKQMPETLQARFNVAPTQSIPVISNDQPDALTLYRWGLIPFWAQDTTVGARMINARSETLHEKRSFKHAYRRRRCLIPANGFYEWKQADGKGKQPYYIHLKDDVLFAFAGLWDQWRSPDGETIRSCTIITAPANAVVAPLHDRMPVMLHKNDYDTWLAQDEMPPDALAPLLRPYDGDAMEAYPVSHAVNSPRNDTPDLINRLEPPEQPGLL